MNIAAELGLALLGAVLGLLLKPALDWIASLRGEYSGEWQQLIPPFEGEPEKIATVRLKHVGDRLTGTTTRTQPRMEYPQKWEVDARVKRDLIFGSYWPQKTKYLPGSYGTLQFKIRDENHFEGFYVRARSQPGAGLHEFQETLKAIPIRWERVAEPSRGP